MKDLFRTLFSPVLRPLESGDEPFSYKPSHRKILIIVSLLFSFLAAVVLSLNHGGDMGYLFPVVVFGVVGVVGLVVGFLGSDRAVAKIWGSR